MPCRCSTYCTLSSLRLMDECYCDYNSTVIFSFIEYFESITCRDTKHTRAIYRFNLDSVSSSFFLFLFFLSLFASLSLASRLYCLCHFIGFDFIFKPIPNCSFKHSTSIAEDYKLLLNDRFTDDNQCKIHSLANRLCVSSGCMHSYTLFTINSRQWLATQLSMCVRLPSQPIAIFFVFFISAGRLIRNKYCQSKLLLVNCLNSYCFNKLQIIQLMLKSTDFILQLAKWQPYCDHLRERENIILINIECSILSEIQLIQKCICYGCSCTQQYHHHHICKFIYSRNCHSIATKIASIKCSSYRINIHIEYKSMIIWAIWYLNTF